MRQVDNIISIFEGIVKSYPNNCAFKSQSASISFSELSARGKRIAHNISEYVPAGNKPIAVFLPKSEQFFESIVGILYSGNFYIPIDVKSPESRILAILKNANPDLIISNKSYEPVLKTLTSNKVLFLDEIDHTLDPKTSVIDWINIRQNTLIDTDPVYMIYTSGSTGVPKGVLISHKSVIDYISWAGNLYEVNTNTIIGSQAPFYFDNSTLDIYLTLMYGACFVLIPESYFVYPAQLIGYLNEERINFIFWVPSVLINIANLDLFKDTKPQYLTKVLFAGEVMPNKHLNYWRKNLNGILYSNLYGPTEITVDCTYYIVDREFSDDEPLPIGFPCKNTDILILNEDDQIVSGEEIGELCVRGSSLALGYYNDFEKTAKSFCQNPLNKSYPERIYRTGDLVYRNKLNEIIFCGRKDFQIKHMGYRIELGEIENAIISHHKVANCCVLYNSSKKHIVAFYTAPVEIGIVEFKEFLSKQIPAYMIPRVFERVEEFQLNANGKVDRIYLATLLK